MHRRYVLAVFAAATGNLLASSFMKAEAAERPGSDRRRAGSDSATSEQGWYLSAADDSLGQHFIVGADSHDETLFRLPVDQRGHGGCMHPSGAHAVVFARRPGDKGWVIERSGHLAQTLTAGKDHHFYGHGVFSRDGRFLYTTANHFPSGQGRVLVFEVAENYRFSHDIKIDGIGPHELVVMPDGETLAVALGGIKTHPDYERIKLNLDSMAPALLLIDRQTGQETRRFEPSHHQLSVRHLDVSADGTIVVGYQFQGPEWEQHPLIGILAPGQSELSEPTLNETLVRRMRNYTASVACHSGNHCVAITAPRGGLVLMLDYQSQTIEKTYDVTDAAGAMAWEDGFRLTSGDGSVLSVEPRSGEITSLDPARLRWDNHLIASR